MKTTELRKNLFLFQFKNGKDKARTLAGVPWHFDMSLVVLKEIARSETLSNSILNHSPFWERAYDLLLDCRTFSVAKPIGHQIGSFLNLMKRR